MKTQCLQLGLQGVDGGFERGVFAGDKVFCGHPGSISHRDEMAFSGSDAMVCEARESPNQ
jgi:hypothetical protein